MFGGQIAIIFIGGRAFSIVSITGLQWAVCIGLAFTSMPWAIVIRCIPDEWAERAWNVAGAPVANVLSKAWNGLIRGLKKMLFWRKEKKTDEEEEGTTQA